MNLLTILLVVGYLMVVGYVGYRGYRGTRSVTDYMLAGRSVHPFIMALSYGATFISTSAIVGFGGAAAMFGMGLFWLVFLNILLGIFVCFVFFGARTRAIGHHLDAHTFPEFLGRRFDSRFLQVAAGFVIVLFMPLYTAVVSMGAARVIEVTFSMPYEAALFSFSAIVAVYVVMGGLKGVMYADAVQGAIMFVGMCLLLVLTYAKLGGVVSAHQTLTDMAPLAEEVFGPVGHRGWTAMPAFGSKFWWVMVSSIIMGVGIGVLAQPQLAVRYLTVKGTRELNRATLVGGLFILMLPGVAYTVGSLSNVFFYNDPEIGKIAFLAADKDIGRIIPMFIERYMPWWLGAFIVVTLLAAAMSTVSSQFHAMGTAVSRDIFECMAGRREHGSLLAARCGIVLTFLFSVTLAYVLPVYFKGTGTAIIARGTALFFGLCCSTFLPMYMGALYTRRITRAGAIGGGLAGFAASAVWLLFIHQKESEALQVCRLLFGKPSLAEGMRSGFILWPEVDPLFVALPVALIVTVAVSSVTRPFSKAHLDHCFARVR